MNVLKVTTADGLTIVAEDAGPVDGPPVLLIGGHIQPRSMWASQVGGLADHYHVVTYDARDVGDSDKAVNPYDSALLADDAAAVLDAFGVECAAVAGLSLGGCVALQLALRHPARVSSLCTASCWARPDAHLRAQFQYWIDLVEAAGFGFLFRLMLFMSFSAETQEQNGDLSAMADVIAQTTDTEAFCRQVTADLAHALPDEELATIAVPLLALWGTEDLLVPKRHADALVGAVSNAELGAVEGVSHSMVNDHPERYTAALRTWFDRQA